MSHNSNSVNSAGGTSAAEETLQRPHPKMRAKSMPNTLVSLQLQSDSHDSNPKRRLQRPSLPTTLTSSQLQNELHTSSPYPHPLRPRPGLRTRTWTLLLPKKDTSNAPPPLSRPNPQSRHDSAALLPSIGGAPYSQEPRQAHKPNTPHAEKAVYVLTLKTSASLSDPLTSLRKKWFPAHLNRTPAHLTLFHALPHSRLDEVEARLVAGMSHSRPFRVSAGRVFRMRRGVGVGMGAGLRETAMLHDSLRGAWAEFLSEQDGGGWRPHWTVMNRVEEAETVEEAMGDVKGEVERGISGMAVGVDLWRYEGGEWGLWREFVFEGGERKRCTWDMGDAGGESEDEGESEGRRDQILNRFGWRDRLSGFVG